MTERRDGHSKIVYDKETRSLKTVDPHPETSDPISLRRQALEELERQNADLRKQLGKRTEALKDTLNMLRAAHMQCGVAHDSNKRVIKARAALTDEGGKDL